MATLLYVDDDADFVLLATLVLGRYGFDVTTAGSVAEALAHLEATRFDVVVADMRLPDGSGEAVLAKTSGLRALATGLSRSGSFDLYFEKPFDLDKAALTLLGRLRAGSVAQ